MLGVAVVIPRLIGAGSRAIGQSLAGMISSGMRGGLSFARAGAQNWSKIPLPGKMTGTAVWIDVNILWEEFASRMAAMQQRVTNMEPVMEQVCIFLESRIKERIRDTLRNTPRASKAGAGIASTGRLASDWSHVVTRTGQAVIGEVGTRVKYARIHEFGGTIRPKKKTALTVPFPGNVGVYPPAFELMRSGYTFIKKDIIFYKTQQMAKPIPIYILKKSVYIPARPYVAWTLAVYGDRIQEMLGRHVETAIKRG